MADYDDVETALSSFSYSEYSEPPSEVAVTFAESVASQLSLNTCATSVSQYSEPPSEANVEFSQIETFNPVLIQIGLNDDALNPAYSDYSLPPSEADVDMDKLEMLYPQSYFTKLVAPEREECDTRAPPQMSSV